MNTSLAPNCLRRFGLNKVPMSIAGSCVKGGTLPAFWGLAYETLACLGLQDFQFQEDHERCMTVLAHTAPNRTSCIFSSDSLELLKYFNVKGNTKYLWVYQQSLCLVKIKQVHFLKTFLFTKIKIKRGPTVEAIMNFSIIYNKQHFVQQKFGDSVKYEHFSIFFITSDGLNDHR